MLQIPSGVILEGTIQGIQLGTNGLPYQDAQRIEQPIVLFRIVEDGRSNHGTRLYHLETESGVWITEQAKPEQKESRPLNGTIRLISEPDREKNRLFLHDQEHLAILRDKLIFKGIQIPRKAAREKLVKQSFVPKQKALKALWKAQTKLANVTCPITGISYQISTTGIQNWTFIQPHPFAFYGNVREYVRQTKKEGKLLTSLSQNELAGMVISCLRNWKFLSKWQECGSLNLLLQSCSQDLLIRAINTYVKLTSAESMPGITFTLEKTEVVLANHLSLITGKHWLDVGERKYQNNDTPIKAKVISRKDKFGEWKETGLDLIRYLKVGASQVNQRRLKEIASFLKIPEHCGSPVARLLAKEITGRFPENESAKELSGIFLEIAVYSESKQHGKDDFDSISEESTLKVGNEQLSLSEVLAKRLAGK